MPSICVAPTHYFLQLLQSFWTGGRLGGCLEAVFAQETHCFYWIFGSGWRLDPGVLLLGGLSSTPMWTTEKWAPVPKTGCRVPLLVCAFNKQLFCKTFPFLKTAQENGHTFSAMTANRTSVFVLKIPRDDFYCATFRVSFQLIHPSLLYCHFSIWKSWPWNLELLWVIQTAFLGIFLIIATLIITRCWNPKW
jgi:hypothetical protein